jgi:hypothetical protein
MEKSKEQIELAQSTIALLQDYVELAKTEKKLKDKSNKETTNLAIQETLDKVIANVKEL